jgi:purine-cytosine permease-like protein
MGLLWVTMVTSFPTVLVGFEWFKLGITLPQVLLCTTLACLVLLAYTIPTAQLSAITGKGYGLLNVQVFGARASVCINLLLLSMFTGFYGLCALFMAEGVNSLFHLNLPTAPMAAVFAVLMAFNNFFGFSGVANFARFVAAPALLIWVLCTFCRAAAVCPHAVMTQTPPHAFSYCFGIIATFVIGFAIWGNESDYWRYGKPRVGYSAVPLAFALAIGEIIFPATGWMVARVTSITDYSAATNFMSNYSFAGLPIVGIIVLGASYFASNDSNLFGSSTAFEITFKARHKYSVALLTILGAAMAYTLAAMGAEKALDAIAALNCIILPTPSVIVLTNWVLARRFGVVDFGQFSHATPTIALIVGIGVGLATAGVLPGLHSLQFGFPCLQAWSTAALIFAVLRIREYTRVPQFALTMAEDREKELALTLP